MNDQKSGGKESVERDILADLAREALRERRRSRRWGIFFKSVFGLYLIAVTVLIAGNGIPTPTGPHTALVDLEGTIEPNSQASADTIIEGLRDAFKAESSKAVILRINSPGGSPVQASEINSEIHRLREKYPDKPVYAVVTDMCASGGYYVAVAADRIYANRSSIVGSIGVLMNGFGFVDAMNKLGIQRRLFTAGKHKGLLDPFSPLKPFDKEYAEKLLDQVHQQFVDTVKADRGERLSDNPDIFSGLFWTGQEALRLGLIDEYGSVGSVARDVVGADTIVDYTPHQNLFGRVTRKLGVSIANSLRSSLLSNRFELQ
ncbi:MAG: signal peptide peptidase SppA [Arenicellales bacterium]